MESIDEVVLHEAYPRKIVKIGSQISLKTRDELVSLLREFRDVFAWEPKDMPGIPESIALHRLNIKSGVHPVKQKKGCFRLKSNKL